MTSGAPKEESARDLLKSRSVGRRANHSASIRRFEANMLEIPFHKEVSQSARAMADELRVKDRIAPVVIVGKGRCTHHLPARQCGTGFGLGAVAEKKGGDAALPRSQS